MQHFNHGTGQRDPMLGTRIDLGRLALLLPTASTSSSSSTSGADKKCAPLMLVDPTVATAYVSVRDGVCTARTCQRDVANVMCYRSSVNLNHEVGMMVTNIGEPNT